MFLLKTLYYIVTLRPMDFTNEIKTKIRNKINASVEGKCLLPHGFIICVDEILKILPLQVNEEGHALFKVKYNALVFKPYNEEVIDVVVSRISSDGIDANAGFFTVGLSTENIRSRLEELHGGKTNAGGGDHGDDANDAGMDGKENEVDDDDDEPLKDGSHRVVDDCLKIKVCGKVFEFSVGMVLRVRIFKVTINNQQIVNISKKIFF